jgi:hypothetical protein
VAVNPNVQPIAAYARKQFEEMGEAAVRQFCNDNVWPGWIYPSNESFCLNLAGGG